MIDPKEVHQVLRCYLFEPNTKELRAEMVAALEDMGNGIMAQDMTGAKELLANGVCIHMWNGFKEYEVNLIGTRFVTTERKPC